MGVELAERLSSLAAILSRHFVATGNPPARQEWTFSIPEKRAENCCCRGAQVRFRALIEELPPAEVSEAIANIPPLREVSQILKEIIIEAGKLGIGQEIIPIDHLLAEQWCESTINTTTIGNFPAEIGANGELLVVVDSDSEPDQQFHFGYSLSSVSDDLIGRIHELSRRIALKFPDSPREVVTLKDAAKISRLSEKTIRNQKGKPKAALPAVGNRPAVYHYCELRKWMLTKWPHLATTIPESFDEARKILSVRAG